MKSQYSLSQAANYGSWANPVICVCTARELRTDLHFYMVKNQKNRSL